MLNLDLEGCFYNNFGHFPRNFLSQIKEVKSCAKDREQFRHKNGQTSCKLSRKPSHLGENLNMTKTCYYIFQDTKTNFELEIKEWSVGSMGSVLLVMDLVIWQIISTMFSEVLVQINN